MLSEPVLLHAADYTRRHPEFFGEMERSFGASSNDVLQAAFWKSDLGYLFLEESGFTFLQKDFYERIRNASAEVGALSYLDVGCGYGHLCVWLKQRYPDAEVVGMDVSTSCLRAARRNAKRKGVSVRFVEGMAGDLAKLFAAKSVDAVVCTEAFMYFEDGLRVLEAMCRIARKWVFVTGGLGHLSHEEYRAARQAVREHNFDRYWVHPLPAYAAELGLPVHAQGPASLNCYYLDVRF
jgi:SAM-dependent methyltransferase